MVDESHTGGVAAVVGAGTMGGGIAADLSNAGWTVHLLDVSTEAAARGLERVRLARPPLLFLPEFADRILIGEIGKDRGRIAEADWVVEAVAESPEAKRAALATIEAQARPDAIVTSNTSGLGLAAMSAHCGPAFRRRFFGAHFLNPPRYLKLLEVIPTPETAPEIVAGFVRFAEQVLGHRVVLARDTPGFISTRLWITHLLDTIHTAATWEMGIETVDALTGPLIGRPRSATFRMADVVGLDIVAAVAANQHDALPNDPLRERLRLPDLLRRLLDAGRTGEKAGGGFYCREGETVLALDPATMEYRPRHDGLPADLEPLLRRSLPERFAALRDRAVTPETRFLDVLLDRLADYVALVGPEIADDILAIDRTMQWGFGWEMGPFAMQDCRAPSAAAPGYAGPPSRRTYRAFGTPARRPWPDEPEYIDLAALKAAGARIVDSEAASLVDLGEGVLCLEFHTKMNTLRPETCAFILGTLERAARESAALVIGNQGAHFSAGYDLNCLVPLLERQDLAAVDVQMRACQEAFQAIKYAPIPVVAAPHGFALGGGCECLLHCRAVQAAPDLRAGLPEIAAGVIPCGGGHKETLLRAGERPGGHDAAPIDAARAALRAIVLGRHTDNAYAARQEGWLRPADGISHNADRRLYEAKQRALALAAGGCAPPSPPSIPAAGAPGLARLREEIAEIHAAKILTDYDAMIADHVAVVLCGGESAEPGAVSEQTLLDLERAAFLDLCRDPRTLARMRHMLETGKRLRN